jgi:hypothetical protein
MSNRTGLISCLAAVLLLANVATAGDGAEEARLRELLIRYSDYLDPASVEFRNLHFRDLQWPSWCGEINAKNQLGGYVGWRTFAAYDRRYRGARDQRANVEFLEGAAAERACSATRNHWARDWEWQ